MSVQVEKTVVRMASAEGIGGDHNIPENIRKIYLLRRDFRMYSEFQMHLEAAG